MKPKDFFFGFDTKGFSRFSVWLFVFSFLWSASYAGFPKIESFIFGPTPEFQSIPPIVSERASTLDERSPASERIIRSLSVEQVVPSAGKFIAADLSAMKLSLYENGAVVHEFPILTKGRAGTPWETPGGFYSVGAKEINHFSSIGKVHMPFSMQFFGNYFIHGWPYHEDGTPVVSSYSGGCIRLDTADAGEVFDFADKGTQLFVFDGKKKLSVPPLSLRTLPLPEISAETFLVADLDTGDVLLEKNTELPRPVASITKLMTALVANEAISFDKKITVPRSSLLLPQKETSEIHYDQDESFSIGEMLYPLLMESNNDVADALSNYYGSHNFISWMNTAAKAFGMESTQFSDASGISSENVSTPDDLFRLAAYIANKKSFLLGVTKTPEKELISEAGKIFHLKNFNEFSDMENFMGGKTGRTALAGDTMLALFTVPADGETRRVAVVVLGSKNHATDTKNLFSWVRDSVDGISIKNAACLSCPTTEYRKIQF